MIRLTKQLKFYDAFTLTGGGGVLYYPGNVVDRITAVVEFGFKRSVEDCRLTFTPASGGDLITISNVNDARRWDLEGFKIGSIIDITGTPSNDRTGLTILDIIDDGKTIRITDSGELVSETAASGNIFDTTPITDLDYFYNLLPKSYGMSFAAIGDPNAMQRFTATGLDATDTTTTIYFKIPQTVKSFAPVKVTNDTTWAISDCYIKGNGIVDYEQRFKITHGIRTTPYSLVDFLSNYSNESIPDLWSNGLQYFGQVNAKLDPDSQDAYDAGTFQSEGGIGAWFDSGIGGKTPEYWVSDITYLNATPEYVSALETSGEMQLVITLNSKSAKFNSSGTVVRAGFFIVPSDPTRYQGNGRTLEQCLFFDQASFMTGAGSPSTSEYNGTDYQFITSMTVTHVSTSKLLVNLTVQAGTLLTEYWQALADGDRNYALYVITQDKTITTTRGTDRVTCLADYNSATYDQTDDTLSELVSPGLLYYEYPSEGTAGAASVHGAEGDPGFADCSFRMSTVASGDDDTTPTLMSVTASVVAAKSGNDDFVLESLTADISGVKKLLGVQDVEYSVQRGFITTEDDKRNLFTVTRDADNDITDYVAFKVSYGFALRFESWQTILQNNLIGLGGIPQIAAIEKDITDVDQRWKSYDSVEGWSLRLKFSWKILDCFGVEQEFYTYIPITIASNTTAWPSGTGPFTAETQYFTTDDEEINSVLIDDITLIRTTFTGTFTLPTDGAGYYGWMCAVVPVTGSVFDRRFASTELPSEATSPWSATDADPDAITSYANGNLRMNIYSDRMVVEGYFDATKVYEQNIEKVVIYSRLGATYSGS